MNYEKILALLVAKFQGVRKDGLEQMARTLALQCSNEEEAKNLVEKITDAQVTDFVKEYRRIVDKEVSEAGKTLEETIKKKYKIEENPNSKSKVEEHKPNDDISTVVANAVASAIKPLQEELNRLKEGEVGKSRLQALQDKLSVCKDETFKAQTLKDFARMKFDDDNAFNEYLTEKETDIQTANQNVANDSLRNQGGRPMNPDGSGEKKEATKEQLDEVMERLPI